ncbi:MAG: hypothetical protein COV67_07095 [Nitrospinae bacterium CG11_big_fil_rev_8_21_14_0_20_56_8]|nr:MAG: hypothetical protein COV67_07095 [Nitrospinae bacterium CG11_big_fil_rev_8_21_14_0_20_56_8]
MLQILLVFLLIFPASIQAAQIVLALHLDDLGEIHSPVPSPSPSDNSKGRLQPDPFAHILKQKEQLGLTEEQLSRIEQIGFEHKKNRIRDEAELETLHIELERELHSEEIDPAIVELLSGKLSQARANIQNATLQARLKIMQLLTPEQRKKTKQLFSAHP